MRKSVKIRKIIFEILYEIHKRSINYDESLILFTKKISLNEQERSMIYNVTLNSMRNWKIKHSNEEKLLKNKLE